LLSSCLAEIPFPDRFADITMGGHVFGENPHAEYRELLRVTRSGGMIILCPGNSDRVDDIHGSLLAKGFSWSRFEEPQDGWERKYRKKCAGS